jgi:hypothetical protein
VRAAAGSSTDIVVLDGDDEVARWTIDLEGLCALAVVDLLARTRLEARRRGWSIALVDPNAALCKVLEFAGLADLFDGP